MNNKGVLFRILMTMSVLLATVLVMAPPGAALEGIPADATILSATLHLTQAYNNAPAEIRVHRALVAWDEMTVTWNSFGGQYDPIVEAAFLSGPIDHQVDVTGLVQGWVYGTYPNYGLLLDQDLTKGFTCFNSSQSDALASRPALVLCYSTPTIPSGCVTIQADGVETVPDTFIWEANPNQNYGASGLLYTGLVANLEKQSLLWFDLPTLPPPPSGAGCTPGYWKNHLDAWWATGYSTNDDFDATFGVDLFNPNITLLQAINAKGGGVNRLARHGTAALLSAAHPDVDYPYTIPEVIALVQAGDADALEWANELGCPLD